MGAQENELPPDTFTLGRFGLGATWEMMACGAQDHTGDDVNNLNCAGGA